MPFRVFGFKEEGAVGCGVVYTSHVLGVSFWGRRVGCVLGCGSINVGRVVRGKRALFFMLSSPGGGRGEGGVQRPFSGVMSVRDGTAREGRSETMGWQIISYLAHRSAVVCGVSWQCYEYQVLVCSYIGVVRT